MDERCEEILLYYKYEYDQFEDNLTGSPLKVSSPHKKATLIQENKEAIVGKLSQRVKEMADRLIMKEEEVKKLQDHINDITPHAQYSVSLGQNVIKNMNRISNLEQKNEIEKDISKNYESKYNNLEKEVIQLVNEYNLIYGLDRLDDNVYRDPAIFTFYTPSLYKQHRKNTIRKYTDLAYIDFSIIIFNIRKSTLY